MKVLGPVQLANKGDAMRIIYRDPKAGGLILAARRRLLADNDVQPASSVTADVVAAVFALLKLIELAGDKGARGLMRRAAASLAGCTARDLEEYADAVVGKSGRLRRSAVLHSLRRLAMRAGRGAALPKAMVVCQQSVLRTVAMHGYSDAMRHALQLLTFMTPKTVLYNLLPSAGNIRLKDEEREAKDDEVRMEDERMAKDDEERMKDEKKKEEGDDDEVVVEHDGGCVTPSPQRTMVKRSPPSPLRFALQHPREPTVTDKAIVFDGPVDDSGDFWRACTLLTPLAAAASRSQRMSVAIQCRRRICRAGEPRPLLFLCLVARRDEMLIPTVHSAVEAVLSEHGEVSRPPNTDVCAVHVRETIYTGSGALMSELQEGARIDVTYTSAALDSLAET